MLIKMPHSFHGLWVKRHHQDDRAQPQANTPLMLLFIRAATLCRVALGQIEITPSFLCLGFECPLAQHRFVIGWICVSHYFIHVHEGGALLDHSSLFLVQSDQAKCTTSQI